MATSKKRKKKVLVIPLADRKLCFKKFRSKHQLVTVTGLGPSLGYKVSSWAACRETILRKFEMPKATEIPLNLWESVQRELAVWFARYVARHKHLPSVRNERGRRKRLWKKLLPKHQAHMETKNVVLRFQGKAKPVQAPVAGPTGYIIIYDPALRMRSTFFRVHSTSCDRVDMERRRVHKKNRKGLAGDSWLLEALTPDKAVRKQVAELDEDDKGYDASDFDIHECCGR